MTDLEAVIKLCKDKGLSCQGCPFFNREQVHDRCVFKGHPKMWNAEKIKKKLESVGD